MATVYEIPIVVDEPRFRMRTVLDEIELVLFIYWTTRQERWNLDILDANENRLVSGLVLNVNVEQIRQFKHVEGLPQGSLALYDTSGENSECGYEDLGDRCKLIYQSALD